MASVAIPSEMISPEEMAPRCGMSPENIRAALRQGLFPVGFAFNTGKSWRYYITRAEFEDWMAGVIPSNQKRIAELIVGEISAKLTEGSATA